MRTSDDLINHDLDKFDCWRFNEKLRFQIKLTSKLCWKFRCSKILIEISRFSTSTMILYVNFMNYFFISQTRIRTHVSTLWHETFVLFLCLLTRLNNRIFMCELTFFSLFSNREFVLSISISINHSAFNSRWNRHLLGSWPSFGWPGAWGTAFGNAFPRCAAKQASYWCGSRPL